MTPEETLKLKAKARLRLKEKQGQAVPERNWLDIPGEAMGNLGVSAYNTAEGLYNVVRHPIDTLQSGIDATIGGLRKLTPAPLRPDSYLLESKETTKRRDDVANAAGQVLTDRYGGMDQIKNTLATDPVGSVLDIGSVIAGGAGLAGRGPMALSKIPQATRIPGQTWASEKLLRNAMPDNPNVLDAYGPEAMALDASPSMTGLAQGVATTPNAQKNLIVDALLSRDKGRSARLQSDVRQNLGKSRDPEMLKRALDKSSQRQAGPIYNAAKENAPELYNKLDDILAKQLTNPAAGMAPEGRAVMSKIMTEIDDALAAGDPALTAERLHNIRQNLDKKIVYDEQSMMALSSADKAAQGPLKQARAAVDDILKNRVPGFDRADAIVSDSKKAQGDIDYGFKALDGGKSAKTPERFIQDTGKRDMKFVREGMKADIRNATGTQANDLSALRKRLGGDFDFNREKLSTAFGKERVDKLIAAIDREGLFAQNYADVARNSQTAQRQAAEKLVGSSEPVRISDSASFTGLGGKAVAKGLNALLGKAATKYSSRNAEALAKALSLKGADAQKLLRDLSQTKNQGQKLRKIVQALVAAHAAETVNRPHR